MTAKTKARIRMGATLVPLFLGLLMIVVGTFGVAGDAGAATRPSAGQFHIGGTESFPMFSNLVLDFGGILTTGTFTGSVNMTHANAVGDDVNLTLNSLTQTFAGFTITLDGMPQSVGMAMGTPGVPNPIFPANSLLTVNYCMRTPFAPPNDQLKGTHTLQANNINCWPPTEIYSGTMPSNILRKSDNAVVGQLRVPYHSKCPPPPPGGALLSSGHLILFGALVLIVGFALIRRSAA